MKIQKKTISKKYIISAAVIVALLAGGAAYAYAQQAQQSDSKTSATTLNQEKSAGNQAKNKTVESNSDSQPSSSSENTATKGEIGDNALSPGSISISASSQNGSIYQLRTLIDGVVTGGTCTLTLTKDGATVTKSSSLAVFAQSSTCQGFDVPVTELSPGMWNLEVSFKNATVSGSTKSEIEVK